MDESLVAPRVTIVVTARERHSLTEATLDSVVADTAPPYKLLYLDAQSPAWLCAALAARAHEWNLTVVPLNEPLWPHEARRRIAPAIDTEYVVFLDNDVQVEPGWLDALVACADETGAGIVGPLYLWGDGIGPERIHMAGGKLVETREGDARVLHESHYLFNADPRLVRRELTRRPCDFVEFHCMLVRTALLRDPEFLDPAIRCVHEHIDVALKTRAGGGSVWLEPAARVHYMAFSEYMLDDLPFFRQRWSASEGEASLAAFRRRWNVIDDARSFGGVRSYLASHVQQIDPLRCDAPRHVERRSAMRPAELVQSRSALLDLALARGYAASDILTLVETYALAQRLLDGAYRPCGRPFINHLAGTAGVLLRYDFAPRVVAAGLAHAAYSHGRAPGVDAESVHRTIAAALGGPGSALETRVRAYTERESAGGADAADPESLAAISISEAEILAIEAANEIDMLFSGEVRYTGRTDLVGPATLARIAHACRIIGVDGLFATLEQARAAHRLAPEPLRTRQHASYRLAPAVPDFHAAMQGRIVTQ